MLRTLFPKSHPRYEQSRCASELEAFADWLEGAGYMCRNVRGHIRRLHRALGRHRREVSECRHSERTVQQMFAAGLTSRRAEVGAHATERLYRRFIETRGRLITTERRTRHASELVRYRGYLTDVRGFAAPTIDQHLTTVADFLRHALGAKGRLPALTSQHAEAYVASRASTVRRESLQHIVAHLRAFLRYCVLHDLLRRRPGPIDTPRTYRGERPPRALPWPLIQQLLASIDRAEKSGWRDYAILHLMAHYGLRPSEIVTLRLDSIDWAASTLQVEQRKTQSKLLLPLMPRTMTILRRYLVAGRPYSEHPQLFLRARDPAGPLKHTAICDVFSKRASRIGLPLERYSSYSLRHGFAVHLLDRGVGIKAIGDVLGHRSFESTQVYLRLETEKLRAIALPVPQSPRSSSRRPSLPRRRK